MTTVWDLIASSFQILRNTLHTTQQCHYSFWVINHDHIVLHLSPSLVSPDGVKHGAQQVLNLWAASWQESGKKIQFGGLSMVMNYDFGSLFTERCHWIACEVKVDTREQREQRLYMDGGTTSKVQRFKFLLLRRQIHIAYEQQTKPWARLDQFDRRVVFLARWWCPKQKEAWKFVASVRRWIARVTTRRLWKENRKECLGPCKIFCRISSQIIHG